MLFLCGGSLQYMLQRNAHEAAVMLQVRPQESRSPQHRSAGVAGPTALHAAVPVLHQASAAASRPAVAEEEADEEEPETMPLLARRVMAGRQSIIPGHPKVDVLHCIPSSGTSLLGIPASLIQV